MNKLIKPIICFTLLVMLCSILLGCEGGKWEVNELYAQKIEGTSKILYKYDAWGGRDSHASGYVILDSTEPFQVKVSNNLPFLYLQEVPNKTMIKGVTHLCDNSCGENYKKATPIFTPIKKETSDRQNIEVVNIFYQYKGYAERTKGLETFQFEKFKETRDSLLFYNLDDVESLGGRHVDTLKFRKTDVSIAENNNHEIIEIVLENLVIDKNSNEIILYQPYFLTPKNKLNSNAFSDYGIFKQVVK